MVRSDIGAHASIKDGILEGIKYIEKIGGNVIQIFLGSNQSASIKNKRSINIEEANAIRKYLKLNQLKLFIHAVYILNLSSFTASSQRIEYARQNLLYDLKKGSEIGAKGVVVHLGYRKTLTNQEAYFNMADNVVKVVVDLLKFQDQSKEKSIKDSRIKLILETPAGAGTQIGTTLEDLDKLWNIIKELSKKYQSQNKFILNYKKILDRIGFCIDTAHIFSSGNPVTNPATMVTYLEKFIKTFGKSKLTCFHINDSKASFNSRRDLHHGLGQGHLFKDNMDTLQEIWNFSNKYNIPMILETHGSGFYDTQKDKGLYQVEINLFREWDMKKKDYNPVPEFLESYQRVFDPKILKSINDKRSLSKESKKKKGSKNKKSKQSKKVSRLGNHYTMYNNNKLIVDTLNRVKQYYQLISDKIHVIAYQKAIYQLKRYPYNIESGNQVANLPGIGKGMITKIDTIITTGRLPFLSQKSVSTKLKRLDSIDLKLNNLMEIPGIGEKKGTELIESGYDTIKNVKDAVKNGDIKLTSMQLIGLKHYDNTLKKIPRLEAKKIYRVIKKSIHNKITLDDNNKNDKSKTKFDLDIIPAGSYPSGKSESKDIDIIIVVNNQTENIDSIRSNLSDNQMNQIMTQIVSNLKGNEILVDILSQGNRNLMGYINLVGDSPKVVHLDLKLVSKYNFPFTYLHFTSGVDFNRYIRNHANKLDYLLSDLGLFQEVAGIDTDNKIKVSDKDINRNRINNKKFKFNDDFIRNIVENEKKIFEYLGLNYVSIKNRR